MPQFMQTKIQVNNADNNYVYDKNFFFYRYR